MTSQRYEDRHRKLYGLLKREFDDEHEPLVISYFCKRERASDSVVTGKVKSIPEINFDYNVDIRWCFDKIRTLVTTKKGGLRKTMEDLKPYQTYELSALLEYLRKEWREGNDRVIISWREKKILGGGKLL
jgi:hypothetical protein